MGLFSFLGGSGSESSSQAQSSGRSFVDPNQYPALNFVRNLGMDAAGQQMGALGGFNQAAQGAFGQGQQFLGNLGQIGGDQRLQAQIGALGGSLGQFFNQQILPGIQRNAVATGGMGGSRQGVAQGVAAGNIANAFSQGAAGLIGNAEQQRLAANLGGLGALPSTLGLLQQPFATQQSILANLAGVIGSPTVLSENEASSSSTSRGFGLNMGFPIIPGG